MICEEKIQQPLPLENSVEQLAEGPDPKPKFPQLKGIWKTPEGLKEYHRNYHQSNRNKFREYSKKSYQKNRDSILAKRGTEKYKSKLQAYLKNHRAKYPERHKASIKRYQQSHPEYFKNYRIAYAARRREIYQLRKVEICARKKELAKLPHNAARIQRRIRQRRIEEPKFALADAMRATMNRAFRRNWIRKPARTEALLGCTIAEAKCHIESQFQQGMSWQLRSSFVIDHWIPVAAFDLRNVEEAHLAFNWRNLRPITSHDNAVKSDTLPNPLPSWLPPHIAERITIRQSGQAHHPC